MPDEDEHERRGIAFPGETEEDDVVIPFVSTTDHGGPYDPASFEAGYLTGTIEAALVNEIISMQIPVRKPLLPQLDLLAMHNNYRIESFPLDDTDEWIMVELVRLAPGYDVIVPDRQNPS